MVVAAEAFHKSLVGVGGGAVGGSGALLSPGCAGGRPGRHLNVRGWRRRLRWDQAALGLPASWVLVLHPAPLMGQWPLLLLSL